MRAAYLHAFFHRGSGKQGAGLHVVFYFAEYPWITDGGPADHDAVHAITVFVFQRFLRAVYISVPKDWTSQSDHYAFHLKKIPFIYFGVEDHADYHKPSDTFDKIDPKDLAKLGSLMAVLAYGLANLEQNKIGTATGKR